MVEKSNTPEELKHLLNQLVESMKPVIGSLDNDKSNELSRDLASFVKEATSKSPNRRWYEFSAEGLKKAVENLGEIGKPVIDIVGKVVALLSVLQ